jgi:hypothetical protein
MAKNDKKATKVTFVTLDSSENRRGFVSFAYFKFVLKTKHFICSFQIRYNVISAQKQPPINQIPVK